MKPHQVATIVGCVLALGQAGGAVAGAAPAGSPPPSAAPAPAAGKPTQSDLQRKATAAERAEAERLDPISRAAFWQNEANIDPGDPVVGVRLASALRQIGRFDEADAAATKVLVVHPEDLEALLEVARARISGRQGFYAIQPLKLAVKLAPKDWRPVSLMGIALDQSERPAEARTAYQQALALAPDNPAVLSNLAMSYATQGDRDQAETLLRRAVAQPGATIQERQNLALILGLQGHLDEAERLIREDLPPEVASANLAYLKSLAPPPKQP